MNSGSKLEDLLITLKNEVSAIDAELTKDQNQERKIVLEVTRKIKVQAIDDLSSRLANSTQSSPHRNDRLRIPCGNFSFSDNLNEEQKDLNQSQTTFSESLFNHNNSSISSKPNMKKTENEIISQDEELSIKEKSSSVSFGSNMNSYHSFAENKIALVKMKDHSIDVCLLIHGISSMRPWIDATKGRIDEIIKDIKSKYPVSAVRVAIIIYKDSNLGKSSFEVQPFINDPNEIENFLSGIELKNDQDSLEDMEAGLRQILKLDWKSTAKILVQIGNHKELYDENWLSSVRWNDIFKSMINEGIEYNFIELNQETKKVAGTLKKIWDNYLHSIKPSKKIIFSVYSGPTGLNELVEAIKGTVLESLDRAFRQMSTNESTKIDANKAKAAHDKRMETLSSKLSSN